MPCASFKIMADSLKQNSLLWYLRTSDNEKEVQRKRKELSNAFSEKETEELSASKKTRAETELSKPKQNARSMRTFQMQWKKGRQWLNYSVGTNSVTCLYCLDYNTGGGRGEHSAFATKEGCTTF